MMARTAILRDDRGERRVSIDGEGQILVDDVTVGEDARCLQRHPERTLLRLEAGAGGATPLT